MKKTILSMSTLACLALATGCGQDRMIDEPSTQINPAQIAFRASAGKSKANDNGLTELKGGFNVIALDQAGAYIPGFAAPAGDNMTYVFSTTWDWKDQATKEQKLWPMIDASYPLTFFAAYPLSTTVTQAAPTVGAAVVSNLTSAAFAYNTYDAGVPVAFDATKLSVDELGAMSAVTRRPVTGFTELNFKHLMSNMKFNIVVPAKHRAYIHSIKLANVNRSGRSYDYKAGAWLAEPAYTVANNAHFAHFIASAGQPIQEITSAAASVNGLTDGAGGFNTLKLMPQKTVAQWNLGAENAPAAGTFRADAAAWKASLSGGVIDQAAITKWHNQGTVAQGMKDSKGWQGARIEVIYCLVDETVAGAFKNVIGYKSGVDGAAADRLVRVGYELNLNTLNAAAGWEAGKRYTFAIPLGTSGASNGVLLDPDFKDNTGGGTTVPVDNPKTEPGGEITKGGVIQFTVGVDTWLDAPEVDIN